MSQFRFLLVRRTHPSTLRSVNKWHRTGEGLDAGSRAQLIRCSNGAIDPPRPPAVEGPEGHWECTGPDQAPRPTLYGLRALSRAPGNPSQKRQRESLPTPGRPPPPGFAVSTDESLPTGRGGTPRTFSATRTQTAVGPCAPCAACATADSRGWWTLHRKGTSAPGDATAHYPQPCFRSRRVTAAENSEPRWGLLGDNLKFHDKNGGVRRTLGEWLKERESSGPTGHGQSSQPSGRFRSMNHWWVM